MYLYPYVTTEAKVDPHDLDNNAAHTVDSAVELPPGAVLGEDGEIVLTGPIELPPGRFERELYFFMWCIIMYEIKH